MKTKTETKWAKFTYVARKTKFITKMLKTLTLKFLSRLTTPYRKILTRDKNTNFNKFNKCGVYQLTCQYCNKNILDRPEGLFIYDSISIF